MKEAKTNILKAASALFLEGGVKALSVRAIAKRAGVSTIGIYSHFHGKQGVLDALYIEGFEQVSAGLGAVPTDTPPRKAVLQAVRNYLRSAEEYEAHYQLVFGADTMEYEPSPEAERAGIEAFEALTQVAARLLPPDAKHGQKQQAALEIWALVHGFVSFRRHAVTRLLELEDWDPIIFSAMNKMIDAIQANAGAGKDLMPRPKKRTKRR